jgi:hypothetical protein
MVIFYKTGIAMLFVIFAFLLFGFLRVGPQGYERDIDR